MRSALVALAALALIVAVMPPAASALGLPFVDLPTAGGVATDAIDAASKAIVGMIADAVGSLTNEIIKASATVGAPQVGVGNTWFTESYRRTVGVSMWLMAIAAMIAIVGAGVRGKIGDMVGVLLVNIPGSVVAMMLVTVGVDLALGLVDAMTAYTFRSSIPQIQQFLHDMGTTFASYDGAQGVAADSLSPGVALIVGLFVIVAQLVILAVLVIRTALIYIVTLFLPLVLAVQVWPATRHMTRKALEMLAVLIFSKFAIFTCFALGAGAFTSAGQGTASPIQSAIVGLGVMAAAAFSPMLLMSIIPGIAGTFSSPGAGVGARGAVGVTSAAQVMRSTLSNVQTVRRTRSSHSHGESGSSSDGRSGAAQSRGSSRSALMESAHTGRAAGTASSAGAVAGAASGAAGPVAGAAVAAAGESRTLLPPVAGAAMPPRQTGGTADQSPQRSPGGAADAHRTSPTAAAMNDSRASVAATASMPVPAASQTADGFSSVSTRQPFTLEST